MLSKKAIKDIVGTFSTLTAKRLTEAEIENLQDSYSLAFRNYNEKQIKQAITEYLQDGDFFPPRPKDIISRIKDNTNTRHTKELIERYTCTLCGQKVTAISEGLCLDCAGLPPALETKRTLQTPEERDYIMHGRMKCQICGKVGLCIKEPSATGSWRCRECYTGLTGKEIARRMGELVKIMGNKDYKPDWEEEIPF